MEIKLIITATVENNAVAGVRVAGPVQDKMLCYGMLEMAKDAVREFKPSPVEVPDADTQRKLLGVN